MGGAVSSSFGSNRSTVARVPGLLAWQRYLLAWCLGLLAWDGPAAVMVAAFCLALLLWPVLRPLQARGRVQCVGLGLAFGLGLIVAAAQAPPALPEARPWMGQGGWFQVTGRVVESATRIEKRLLVVLRDVQVTLPGNGTDDLDGKLAWTWQDPLFRPAPGDLLQAVLAVKPMHGMANPGASDYEAYRARKGHRYRAWSKGDTAEARILESAPGYWWQRRESLRQRVETLLGPEDSQGRAVIMALLFGDRFWLEQRSMELVRKGGVAHTLALSGLHVGFVALFGFLFARAVGLVAPRVFLTLPRQKLGALAAAAAALVYLWLGGFSPSLLRASLMFTIWGVLLVRGRQSVLLDGLLLTLACILFVAPDLIHDLRLQLSVAAVTGIAAWLDLRGRWIVWRRVELERTCPQKEVRQRGRLGMGLWYIWQSLMEMPRLAALFRHLGRIAGWCLRRALDLLCVSLAAQLAVLPLLIWHFGVISPNIHINLLWIPLLASLVMPLGLAGMGAAALGWSVPAEFLFFGASEVVLCFLDALHWLEAQGWLHEIATLRPGWPGRLGYWLMLLCFWLWARQRLERPRRPQPPAWSAAACLSLALLVLPTAAVPLLERGTVRLTLLDVGQGQSVLLQGQNGRRMLLDGGGFFSRTFDLGRAIVAPACTLERSPKLWAIALSHADMDHMQGLVFPMRHFAPRFFACNGAPMDGFAGKELKAALLESRTPRKVLRAGDSLSLGAELELLILHPPQEFIPDSGGLDANNASLVLRLVWQGQGLALLPGDLEEPGLGKLLDSGADLRAQVLVAPHHGSGGSVMRDFYERVAPEVVLASAGYMNQWDFPATVLREKLAHQDVPLLATSAQGAIRVVWSAPRSAPEVSSTRGGGDAVADCPHGVVGKTLSSRISRE
jgi:competence protein ComEC